MQKRKTCFMQVNARHLSEGVSFPEVMIALGILGVAVVGLLAMYSNCIFMSERGESLTTAMIHAQSVLEEARNTSPIADIATADWNAWAQSEGLDTLPQEAVTVTTSGTNPMTVSVAVTWEDRRGTCNAGLTTKVSE